MLRYSNRRCLLHRCKLPVGTVLLNYQHSIIGFSACFRLSPSASLNIGITHKKLIKWCGNAFRERQNTFCVSIEPSEFFDSTSRTNSAVNESITETSKFFLERWGWCSIAGILNYLPCQTYEVITTSFRANHSTSLTLSKKAQLYDATLRIKSRKSLQRQQQWAFCARLWPAHLHTPTDKVVRNRETLLCKSGRGMGKSKNQHDAGQILRPISSKLLPVINMQFRTLRTTPCSTIMHDGIASASAVSCQDNAEERFKNEGSPKTTKIKVASVEQLKELVLKKDVVGLRKVLSKELWPSYRRLKTFAAELLEVFVTCGKDVEETLWLMKNLASECNRVVLPNSVILQLLTRILTEKGLKATIDYAHYYRNLFLVKSPPDGLFSMHHTAVAEILFTEAFKKNDLPRIQDLCDTLIDLGFLNNSSVYLRAVVKAHLQSNCFDDAFNLWYKNAQKYRAKEGCDLLIRHTILERNLNDVLREKRLRNIFEKLNEVGAFHDGLAELVIELLKVDMTCEAELVFRRLKISGRHFKEPLFRLKNDLQNLPHIEHFATALLSTLLEESCSRNTRKYLNHKLLPEGGLVKDPQESNHRGYIKSLLAVWQPRCRRRQEKGAKKFKANIKELQGLMYATQNVWFDVAAGNNDMESLKRLRIWIMKYNINESGSLKKRLEDFCTKSNVNFK